MMVCPCSEKMQNVCFYPENWGSLNMKVDLRNLGDPIGLVGVCGAPEGKLNRDFLCSLPSLPNHGQSPACGPGTWETLFKNTLYDFLGISRSSWVQITSVLSLGK